MHRKRNPIYAFQHKTKSYTEKEKAGFARTQWFAKEGRGYFIEQSTKPQTLSYALNDSPVALLAWIYEKLHDWTDAFHKFFPEGSVSRSGSSNSRFCFEVYWLVVAWTDEEILTWVSVYWFSRMGPGAAHRMYYEVMRECLFFSCTIWHRISKGRWTPSTWPSDSGSFGCYSGLDCDTNNI